MMTQQVFAQALLTAGELEESRQELLRLLCGAAASSLALRLRDGLTPEACGRDFVAAASLYALAAFGASETQQTEEFKAGDLTVKQSSAAAADRFRALERQAEQLIRPYLADRFTFMGV